MNVQHSNVKVGFLYPGYAAEDDYPRLGKMVHPNVDVELIHTQFAEDAHTVEALSEMGSVPRILEGARKLEQENIHSVLWTSTSASFVLGLEGMRSQINALQERLQVPASTTALAFVRAIQAIGAQRVAIAATYPEDIALLFKQFLQKFNIDVIHHASQGIITAAEVGTLTREDVIQLAINHDSPQAEVLLIPDTALHTVQWIEEMEYAIQKPVLTANQVSFWEALRLAGHTSSQEGLGTLFQHVGSEETKTLPFDV